jgi:hypothetical protein
VAVRPDDVAWTAESLAVTLSRTLDLAAMRAVTLEHSAWLGRVLPSLLTPVFSLRGEPVLDLTVLSQPGHEAPAPLVRPEGV